MEGEEAGWEGSEQSHPPTNNLIFSLSTAKCARTPDARLPEMRGEGSVGSEGCGLRHLRGVRLTDTLTDAFLTLTDSSDFLFGF